ncbi:DUF2167 domain-containing protein [Paenibacillus sinopodophylli]|uniref:DUF2167 domain-containing protein n=1 Tax=Paenibacillus sinopodophylli TaxID=1837342 RepID=UPI001FED1B5A|nr:DUF2167 domain-containing protein [Paenibacillus sinopodophylli]
MKTKMIKMMMGLLGVMLLLASPAYATEVMPEVNWVEGGTTVDVGELSTLQLDESLLFLNKPDTKIIQEYIGNHWYGTELGSVFPADENQNWFVLFEYEEVGHISDKDKDKIDKKKLLKSYKEGTEESNKELAEEDRLYVTGWHTEPYYNEADRTLIWALAAEDSAGSPVINYNVRTLTRSGYVSTLLVTDPERLDEDINMLNTLILPNYSIKEGFRYGDFDAATDKVSEFGLTGLILGGAGLIAAKKAGLLVAGALLLKKFWFLVIALPVALWSWIKRRREGSKDSTLEDSN